MKRSISFIALLLIAVSVAFPQQYGWKDISANVPEFEGYTYPRIFTDVFFISDEEGWITTSTSGGASDSSYILHTTNGGETFEMQKTQFGCEAVHMLNENEGYAGGYQGRIYRTTDGGDNWGAIGSIGSTVSELVFPPTSDTGYATGGLFGNIYKITSSSVSFLVYLVPDALSSFSFPIDGQKGYVCGGSIIMTYANGIWGGAPNSYPSGSYNAVEMVDNMNGWAAGHATIIHTTDGVNWTEQSVPSGIVGELYDLHFLNLNEGWVVGAGQGGGKILHTSNGGQSWVFEAEGLIDDHLLAVNFTSPTNGYAVGLNSMLLKYTEVSGIDENSHSFAFDLFPNPADESVRINCSEFNTESGSIEILSAEGKTLQKKTVGKGNTDIEMDLKNLDAGMYMCRITIGNKRASRKLIIE